MKRQAQGVQVRHRRAPGGALPERAPEPARLPAGTLSRGLSYAEQTTVIARCLVQGDEAAEALAKGLQREATPEGVVRVIVDRILPAIERARLRGEEGARRGASGAGSRAEIPEARP